MTSGALLLRFTHYFPITTLRHFIIRDDEGTLAEYERYLLGLSFSVWMRAMSFIDVCHRFRDVGI